MKPRIVLHWLAALLAALILSSRAQATTVEVESPDILLETRWVEAESGDVLVDTRVVLIVTFAHGSVNGVAVSPAEFVYPSASTALLTAVPDPGYLFSQWTIGAMTSQDNPLSLVMDSNKSGTALFAQDLRDSDGDDLTNYEETVIYQSNPGLWDTDGDGFGDGYEVHGRFNPTSAASTPDTLMAIYKAVGAVKVEFDAGLGNTYRVESSTDLEIWVTVEGGIAGTGGKVERLYSIWATPRRHFRAVRE